MLFSAPLTPAVLLRRYQRFLVDVRLENGQVVTAHCPNTGSMLGCLALASPVLLSRSENPARRCPYSLEMVEADGVWVGVHTGRTNALVREALENGVLETFGIPDEIRAEVRVSAKSRIDFQLLCRGRRVYLEVKNCSLAVSGVAMFPDAVTARGRRHLEELMLLRATGHRAAVLFCVQRADARSFAPAAHIDPDYARILALAAAAGVEVCACQTELGPHAVTVVRSLPCCHG